MIELVIKIDEDVYTRLFDNGIQDNEIAADDVCEMARALRLGTPLPKGHGDLVDRSCICKAIYASEDNLTGSGMTYDEMDIYNCGIDSMWDKLQNANPVIKADKGSDSE